MRPLLAVVLLAMGAFCQSQPPSPTPTKARQVKQHKTEKKEEKAATNDASNDKLVTAINQLVAVIAAKNQQTPAAPNKDKPSPDWWFRLNACLVTLFTAALVVVAYYQAKFMRRGLLISIRSARAATRSANIAKRTAIVAEESLRLSEKAEVLLDRADIRLSMAQKFDSHAWLELTLKNCGHTRAENVVGDFKFIVDKASYCAFTTAPTTLGAGQIQTIPFGRFLNIPKPILDDVLRGQKKLRFYGIYNYDDMFGGSRTGQCVGTFDNGTVSFRIDQTS